MKGNRLLFTFLLIFTLLGAGFAFASGESTLILPSNVTIIEEEAFCGIQGIQEAVLPHGLLRIESRAFAETSIRSVSLPSSITYIAPDAFENASVLSMTAEKNTYAYQWLVDHHYLSEVQASPVKTNVYSITWTTLTDVSSYTVHAYADAECTEPEASIDSSGVDPVEILTDVGKQYWFTVTYIQDGRSYTMGPAVPAAIQPLAAPEHLNASVDENGWVHLEWDAVSGAEGYTLYTREQADWETDLESFYSYTGLPEDYEQSGQMLQLNMGELACIWVCAVNENGPGYRAQVIVSREAENQADFTFTPLDDITCSVSNYTGSATEVIIPATDGHNRIVTSIGNLLNKDSTATRVLIPGTVTGIESFAFSNCATLTEVFIPDSVTSIENFAFYGCSGLTEISIPEGVTSIGDYVFSSCKNLNRVNIPGSLSSIGNSAFSYCTSLTEVNISHGVTAIGDSAFDGCSQLKTVTIPSSVTSIGADALRGVTWIAIPRSVSYLGEDVVSYDCIVFTPADSYAWNALPASCTKKVDWDEKPFPTEEECSPISDFLLSDNFDGTVSITGYQGSGGNVAIPGILMDGRLVTKIRSEAFKDCADITSIEIPCTVMDIEGFSFYGCSGLESIAIPGGVPGLYYRVFGNCTALKEVILPRCLKDISDEAFYNCSSLTSVFVPEGVTQIYYSAFNGCSSLESIIVSGSNQTYTSINGILYTRAKDKLLRCPLTRTSAYVVNGVTSIETYAFSGCSVLASISLPDTLTVIGNSAFSGCRSLQSIELPGNLTTIGSFAFDGCSRLTAIRLPYGLTSIDRVAFRGCTGIKSITVPDTVTNLGESVFYDCRNVTSITLPSGLTAIPDSLCYNCSCLRNIAIPSGVTSIGSWAFHQCSSLQAISLPGGLKTIGKIAFSECSSLKSITIPDGVTSIGTNAFGGCEAMKSVVVPDSVEFIGDYGYPDFGYGLEKIYCVENSYAWTYFSNSSRYKYCLVAWDGESTMLPEIHELTGSFSTHHVALNAGYEYAVEGIVQSTGTDIRRVTLTIDGFSIPDDPNDRYATMTFDGVSTVDIGAWEQFVLNSTEAPLNEPGTYTVCLWASTEDKNGVKLDEMTVTVIGPDENRYASVSGTVTAEDGTPIAGAEVSFYESYTLVTSVLTDADGVWNCDRLQIGRTYTVRVDADLYVFSSMELPVTRDNQQASVMIGQESENYLICDARSIKAEAQQAVYHVGILSDQSWNVSTEESWIHPDVTDGSGNATIALTIDANPQDAIRVGTVYLGMGEEQMPLYVAQLGETAVRLPAFQITAPANDGVELEYEPITVEWTEVPGADYYVVSLRNLDTNVLILNHSVRVGEDAACSTVLTPEYFTYGAEYRLAVGAVPKGFESSDSMVSWQERLFSISEQPAVNENWLYGRVLEYNSSGLPVPVYNATLELYSVDESDEGDTPTYVAAVKSEDDGTWVFHNLELHHTYAIMLTKLDETPDSSGGLVSRGISSGSNPNQLANAQIAATEMEGGNNAGDMYINNNPVGSTGEHGLWARYYMYEDKDTFDDKSLRYIDKLTCAIDFRFSAGTDTNGNKKLTARKFDGSGDDMNLAWYVNTEKMGMILDGYLRFPDGLSTVQVRLRGDDGVSLNIGTNPTGSVWRSALFGDNSASVTLEDVDMQSEYPIIVKYYNNTGTAAVILEYRYKLGSKWTAWNTVPESWFYLGTQPVVKATLEHWDVRKAVNKMNQSLERYIDVTCADLIQNIASGNIMSGISDYLQIYDPFFDAERTKFETSFGALAQLNIGKVVLDTVAEGLGIAVSGLSGQEKAEAIKEKVLALCSLEKNDADALTLRIDYQEALLSAIRVFSVGLKHMPEHFTGLLSELSNILFFDIDPLTGTLYDSADSTDKNSIDRVKKSTVF